MINKEAIKKLQSALKQIDEAQPLCPSPGCDILSNAGMNVDLALEILKAEQPLASGLTKECREYLKIGQLEDDMNCYYIANLCDYLDASQAENKELKEIILTAPGNDEEDFLSKHRTWWDLHYRELRSPGCNLPRSTFKQLEASRKELLVALKKYGDHEPGCIKGDACTCGLKAAIKKAEK